MCKMNYILRCDWLPENLAHLGFPAQFCNKMVYFMPNEIIFCWPMARTRWLLIGQDPFFGDRDVGEVHNHMSSAANNLVCSRLGQWGRSKKEKASSPARFLGPQ